MKVFYRPYIVKLTSALLILLGLSHYVLYCFYQQKTFLSPARFFAYTQDFFYLPILGIFTLIGLWLLRSWSIKLVRLYFIVSYAVNAYTLSQSFNKISAFYLVFLLIILFYFQSLLKEELQKSCYQTNFLKKTLRKVLGQKISANFEGKEATLIHWDGSGGVLEFSELPPEIKNNHIIHIDFQGNQYDVPIGPVLTCTEQKRLSFRFLFSRENNATLRFVRKLSRIGWKPERLI